MNKKLLKNSFITLAMLTIMTILIVHTVQVNSALVMDESTFEKDVCEFFGYAYVNYTVSSSPLSYKEKIYGDVFESKQVGISSTGYRTDFVVFSFSEYHEAVSEEKFTMGINSIDDVDAYQGIGTPDIVEDIDYSERDVYDIWGVQGQAYNISHMSDYDDDNDYITVPDSSEKYSGVIYTTGGDKSISQISEDYCESRNFVFENLINFTVLTCAKTEKKNLNFVTLAFLTPDLTSPETKETDNENPSDFHTEIISALLFPIIRSRYKAQQEQVDIRNPNTYKIEDNTVEATPSILSTLKSIPENLKRLAQSLIPSNLWSKKLGSSASIFNISVFLRNIAFTILKAGILVGLVIGLPILIIRGIRNAIKN